MESTHSGYTPLPNAEQPVLNLKYFKLNDVVDEIAEAIGDAEKRAKFETTLKFITDADKSTFPFEFTNSDVAYRTRYKIMQYLHATKALDKDNTENNTKQYLDGLNTLLQLAMHTNDKDLQAKIYRQQFLNDPQYRTAEVADNFLKEMKAKFKSTPEIYHKRFHRFEELLEPAKKMADKVFVNHNKPVLPIKQVVSVYTGEIYEKLSYIPKTLLTESGKYFALAKQKFGNDISAATAFGAGVLTGMGFVITSVIAVAAGLLSLAALLPVAFSFIARPIAEHTNAITEINKGPDKVKSMTDKKDRATNEMMKVYVEKTATITSIPGRIHRYTSDINTNPVKGLMGLGLFKSKEYVQPIAVNSYQNNNNNDSSSPKKK